MLATRPVGGRRVPTATMPPPLTSASRAAAPAPLLPPPPPPPGPTWNVLGFDRVCTLPPGQTWKVLELDRVCVLPPGRTWRVLGLDRVCALPPRRLSSPRLGSEVSSNAPRSTRGRRAERRSENVEKEGSVSGVR